MNIWNWIRKENYVYMKKVKVKVLEINVWNLLHELSPGKSKKLICSESIYKSKK